MGTLESLRNQLGEAANDIKLNLQSVLETTSLNTEQRWGVAVASAFAARSALVRNAVLEEAKAHVSEPVIEDAKAAAIIMGMNNVFYRFKHIVGKDGYRERPARLRMNRLGRPKTNKVDFELFALAVSAINNCETCVQSHEHAVIEGGLSEEQVHDAVRIAATIYAAAIASEADLAV